MKIRRKLYETTFLFNMDCITYAWNIFEKENIIKVPLWVEIFLFVLFVLIFVTLYSYVLFIP